MSENRAEHFAHRLVGWPSVTGTPDEAAFAEKLAGLIREWPHFAAATSDVDVHPIKGDALGRSFVSALVRGRGSRAVILTGHFDVVPVDNYTDLEPLAFSPDALREALIARLEASGEDPLALADLKSGTFIPGRGMLDMKSGLAAGLAVLEAFIEDAERIGNLLFIAVPDEEENSAGMRAVSAWLPGYLAENGLDAALAINLDSTIDNGAGENGRVVTFGTIGKLLLSASVIGKDSHACYPFEGVNAAYLAAELAVEFECAPELTEIAGADSAAAPTALALKDNKSVYNVTTPGRAFLFWNVLSHARSPEAVFDAAILLAERALARARARMAERAAAASGGQSQASPAWQSLRVMRFSELMAMAENQPGFKERCADEAERIAATAPDLPEATRRLVEFAFDRSGLAGTAIILANASMPYPAVAWGNSPRHAGLACAIESAMADISKTEAVSVERRAFFPAISDISFLGERAEDSLATTARETPLWGSLIDLAGLTASIPTINVGPWGRDYHHWLERAHADYTFRILPDLVARIAHGVLARTTEEGTGKGG